MQGGWFAATGIGILLVGLLGNLWMVLPLWILWLILVVACLLSAAFMFAIMKKLERTTNF
jgi:POT family proton-dependent oligopeptide transporter